MGTGESRLGYGEEKNKDEDEDEFVENEKRITLTPAPVQLTCHVPYPEINDLKEIYDEIVIKGTRLPSPHVPDHRLMGGACGMFQASDRPSPITAQRSWQS